MTGGGSVIPDGNILTLAEIPVVGRDREQAQIDRAIGPGDDGLRIVLLTGASGLGKTTLLRGALGRSEQRGFALGASSGRVAGLATPLAPWFESIPEFDAQLAAASTVRDRFDLEIAGIELVRMLTARTVDRPLLLAFDDAHALDESSLALVSYVAGMDESTNLTLLLVEQTDMVEPTPSYPALRDGLIASHVVQRINVGPLSDEATRELIQMLLGLGEPTDVPVDAVIRAQGNPWFARELAAAYARGETQLPANITAAAMHRMAALDDRAQDIVNAIALCPDGIHIGCIDVLGDLPAREFARSMDAIRKTSLVREDGDYLAIAHPLMQQALVDEMSAAMRRAIHLEIAEAVETVQVDVAASLRVKAYHLHQSRRDDAAIKAYMAAAGLHETCGQLHEALADHLGALQVESGFADRTERLKRAALIAMEVGSERAPALWDELVRMTGMARDNEAYAYALYHRYFSSEDCSTDVLERAAGLGVDEFAWSARAAAVLANLRGDHRTAIERNRRAAELAASSGDALLEALALERVGEGYQQLGDCTHAADYLERALSIAERHSFHGLVVVTWNILVLNYELQLDIERSVQQRRELLGYVERHALFGSVPLAVFGLTAVLIRSGRLEEAVRVAEGQAGHQPSLLARCWLLHARAMVAVEAGDPVDGPKYAAEFVAASTRLGFETWTFDARFLEIRGRELVGDVDAAIDAALRLHIDEPQLMIRLAQWLAHFGVRYARAEAHAHAMEILRAHATDVPFDALVASEVRAIDTALCSGDLTGLRAIADRWRACGCAVEHARAVSIIGLLGLAGGNSNAARIDLEHAVTMCGAIGLAADRSLLAAKVRASGSSRRAVTARTTSTGLTERELQIAKLVAAGHRNAEIADILHVAPKTIAAHLSKIYGKLGIHSRIELASWLDTATSSSPEAVA